MQKQKPRAFTIIELLVVVSIIALLVGILLPAIGKAREQAQLTKSQGNMKQMGTAAQTYAAEYGDRQFTLCNDSISTYGGSGGACMQAYFQANGVAHPPTILGYGSNGSAATAGTYAYWQFGSPGVTNTPGNYICAVPCDYSLAAEKFGTFRMIQVRAFNTYLGGKFYDPVFYAPKDTAVVAAVERWIDSPEEFSPAATSSGTVPPLWSSYCFSPAAMVSPDVLSRSATNAYYTNPWSLPAGFRSPAMSQAQYPDLKTHILEHHWLQNRKKVCNPGFSGGAYDGCQPYFYNQATDSAPVTVYYDGHIGNRGTRDAIDADSRVIAQSGTAGQQHGLWSRDTTWGVNGYYSSLGYNTTASSYHVLTVDGIKGRDFVSK